MITQIHTFGSSHTEGGGFNFDIAKKLYQPFHPKPGMQSLSWVGQLRELIPSYVKINNHAASGGGNERVYRLLFDIISRDDFDKDDTLLLIEPTFLMRKEFWSNSINDYIILNYTPENPASKHNFQVVHRHYQYHTDKNKKLKLKDGLYHAFIKETVNEKEVTKLAQRNLLFLLSFLEQHQIKYLLVNEIDYFSPSWPNQKQFFTESMKSKRIKYFIEGAHTYDIIRDGTENHSISHETNGRHDDFHQGLFVNRVIAQTIYNRLIHDEFILGNEVTVEHDESYFEKIKRKIEPVKNPLI